MRHLIGFGLVAVAFMVGCSGQARPQTSSDAVAALKTDIEENSIGQTTLTGADMGPRTPLLPWDDARSNKTPLPAWDEVMPAEPATSNAEPAKTEPVKTEPAVEGLPDTRN